MRVKRKDLLKFFDIADNYFVSFGNMNDEQYKFVDYFIKKYKLETKTYLERLTDFLKWYLARH